MLFGFADDLEFLRGDAALEGHVIDLVVARDFDLEPVGKCVDAFGADAVEAAGILVGALAEFAAGMEVGQDQLDGGHFPFRGACPRGCRGRRREWRPSRPHGWPRRFSCKSRRGVRQWNCRAPRKHNDAIRARRGRRYTCRAVFGRLPAPPICQFSRRRILHLDQNRYLILPVIPLQFGRENHSIGTDFRGLKDTQKRYEKGPRKTTFNFRLFW